MANKDNVFKELIDELNREIEPITAEMKSRIERDFDRIAVDAIDKYYEYEKGGYTKYGRKYALYGIYEVRSNDRKKIGSFETYIELDSEKLNGVHSSNGSGAIWSSGVPGGLIFDWFLNGKHPWTNGYPMVSGKKKSHMRKMSGEYAPRKILKEYIDSYDRVAEGYFAEIVYRRLSRMVKS